MEGSMGLRGGELRGNPTLERRDAVAVGRAPPGFSAQFLVPGGEPFIGASLEAPPGLQRRDEHPVSSVGRMSRLSAPTGLLTQSPVLGDDPIRCAPSDGHGGFQGQRLAGDVGGIEPPLAPAGLWHGGNPFGGGSKSADRESQNGPPGTSGHGEGIFGDEHEAPGTGAAIGEDNAMVDHLHLLVQGMKQLQ